MARAVSRIHRRVEIMKPIMATTATRPNAHPEGPAVNPQVSPSNAVPLTSPYIFMNFVVDQHSQQRQSCPNYEQHRNSDGSAGHGHGSL
jgi:hypothetical protein